MQLKQKEPLSGNLMTRAGSFKNCTKTNHDFIYIENVIFFLDVLFAHGFYNRSKHGKRRQRYSFYK